MALFQLYAFELLQVVYENLTIENQNMNRIFVNKKFINTVSKLP